MTIMMGKSVYSARLWMVATMGLLGEHLTLPAHRSIVHILLDLMLKYLGT